MSASAPFADYDDWLKRRLNEDAPEMDGAQARDFLIQACARDEERSIQRVFEEAPGWMFTDGVANGAADDETHPMVACMAMESRRCFKAFLRQSDCALWSLSQGRTLLHFAVETGAQWAVSDLLEAGADVSAMDRFGFTALAWARATGQEGIVNAISDRARADGLDPKRVGSVPFNVLSETALQVARSILDSSDPLSDKDFSYLKERCALFKRMGFNPDEQPIMCLLVWGMGNSLNRSAASHEARVAEALAFAIEMGASPEATAKTNLRGDDPPRSALELALALINPDAFNALISVGARRDQLSAPAAVLAWRGVFSLLGYFSCAHSRQMDFLERLSNEDAFWPPFAPNRAAAEALMDSLSQARGKKGYRERLAAAAEALELSISAAPSALPGKGAPRV